MYLSQCDNAPKVARHDFDFVPRRAEVDVAPAKSSDFSILAEMANAKIPEVTVTGPFLAAFATRDIDSILAFRHRGKVVGGVAFLFLNETGLDDLLLGQFDFAAPSERVLARPIDDVAAIYTWATALDGRGILGLGNVAEHLSKRRFRFADLYGRPNTEDGRRLVQSVGFKPIAAFQDNLWIYERAWKRGAPSSPVMPSPTAGYSHA
jgi:hypothetical protein